MLQKLEKEIDDVDAKIGNRWQLLDRYACFILFFSMQVLFIPWTCNYFLT